MLQATRHPFPTAAAALAAAVAHDAAEPGAYSFEARPNPSDRGRGGTWIVEVSKIARTADGKALLRFAGHLAEAPSPPSSARSIMETALCIWEDMLQSKNSYPPLERAFEANGASAMRQRAMDLAPWVDAVYALHPEFPDSFDWEFVPQVLEAVDWDAGTHPAAADVVIKVPA